MLSKEQILENLKSEEEYLIEFDKLREELGFALFTGTLIKSELEELTLKMFEKIALVEFIRSERGK